MPSVRLGNPRPVGALPGFDGEHITEIDVPDSKSFEHAIRDICHDDGTANTGLWRAHSDAPAPSWVESSSPDLASCHSPSASVPTHLWIAKTSEQRTGIISFDRSSRPSMIIARTSLLGLSV